MADKFLKSIGAVDIYQVKDGYEARSDKGEVFYKEVSLPKLESKVRGSATENSAFQSGVERATQNASDAEKEGYMAAQHGVGMTENPYDRPPKMDQWLKGYQRGSKMKNKAFQSGVERATQTINQKAEAVGVKVRNEFPYYWNPDMGQGQKFEGNGKSVFVSSKDGQYGVYASGNGRLLRGPMSEADAIKYAKEQTGK